MLINLNINEFLEEVNSNSPAPGGGSVSSLASALGIALSNMMANLAIGKKKYMNLDIEIREKYEKKCEKLVCIRKELEKLIDEDTKAFNLIMNAYKLPKITPEEQKKRSEAIQIATLEAIKVPYEIAKLSHKALKKISYFVDYGNQNAITDLGVGAMLLRTGLEGALMNVKINLQVIKDKKLVKNYEEKCKEMLEESKGIEKLILKKYIRN